MAPSPLPFGPLCQTDPAGPGRIAQEWQKHPSVEGGLGCALSPEREAIEGEGRYQDFQNGQVVTWTHDGQGSFALTVFVTESPPAIQVQWGSTSPFSYDFFHVRWETDGTDPDDVPDSNCETATVCQTRINSGGDSGSYTIQPSALTAPYAARFRIAVEGCDKAWNPFKRSKCRQGFSNPAYVDYRLPDVSMIRPAAQLSEVDSGRQDRAVIAAQQDCQGGFGDFDEGFTKVAFAKLYLAHQQLPCRDPARLTPIRPALAEIQEVRTALSAAKRTHHVGTDIGTLGTVALAAAAFAALGAALLRALGLAGTIFGAVLAAILGAIVGAICHTGGEYDMALQGLIPIVYRYGQYLEPNDPNSPYNPNALYNHVLDDLLSERGGASKIRKNVRICGLPAPFVPETENHTLMTETSRYLTNQLLTRRANLYQQGPYPGPALDADWDNANNGMKNGS